MAKTYTDATPQVSYTYNKGWRTSASAGNTGYSYTYDGLGRVHTSIQSIGS